MSHSQISLKTSWGDTIYGNAWTIETPIANIVIANGMGEYSYRYNEFANYLNSLGYNVYAVDQPGHGLNVTVPETPVLGLGVWPDNGFKLACSYLYELITQVRLSMKPVILFGHSMGSFVSQRYYQRFNATIDGLILCGSSYNNLTFKASRKLVRIMSTFVKGDRRLRPSNFFANMQTKSFNKGFKNYSDGYKTKNKWLSANEENVKAFDADPLCGFACSFNFYYNLFNGLKPTFQKRRVLDITHKVKILLIAGDKDPVGSKGKGVLKLEKFYKEAGQDVKAILYKGLRHEILNEDEESKQKIYKDIAAFIPECIAKAKEEAQLEEHKKAK